MSRLSTPSNTPRGARSALRIQLVLLWAALTQTAAFDGAQAASVPPAAAGQNSALSLIDRGVTEMRSNPEASRGDAEEALRALERAPDPDLEIRARLILCDYQSERDGSAAERQIAASTALLARAKRQGLRAGVLDCRGEMFETAGDYVRARAQYEQAIEQATVSKDDEMLAQSLFLRGYLLGVQGEYAAGLSDLKRAAAMFDQLGKAQHSLTTLNGIATLYNRMGDYTQARDIYARALKAQRKEGMPREEAVTLHNLGRVYENLHDWSAARQAFTEALALCRQLAYPRGEAYALRGLAAVQNGVGDPKDALATLDRADALQRQTPDARLGAQIQLARGIALHKLGRLPESISALEGALEVFRHAEAMGELNSTYPELATVYADAGNWRLAYDREKLARQTSDTLLSNQLGQRFAALKVEFDTAAKEKENAALLRENEAGAKALAQAHSVRRLQATVIVLSALLVLLLATLAVYQRIRALRMRFLAMTDELTGSPNRRSVLTRLKLLLRDPTAGVCSILIMDIDYFKRINDQHGHPTGDEILKLVAGRVRAAVSEPAFFGRLGGEEFLVVLPHSDLSQARLAAESFRELIMSLDTSPWIPDRRRITASIGCTVSLPGADTATSMLKRADCALYTAKRSGRNCVRTEPTDSAEVVSLALEAR